MTSSDRRIRSRACAEELIGALIWLCSPGAAFVNGTVIIVDGGVMLQWDLASIVPKETAETHAGVRL